MFKKIIQHVSDVVKGKTKLLIARSPKWEKVKNDFLKENPKCSVCNGCEKLQVHHIKPFHLFPELELEVNNLMTLCEKNQCHLQIGHNGDFHKINENIKPEIDKIKKLEKSNTWSLTYYFYHRKDH